LLRTGGKIREDRTGKDQGVELIQGEGEENLAVRMERIDMRSSWRLTLRTFFSARAALTAASSVFNRD